MIDHGRKASTAGGNAFGFLRLLFAGMVILAHTPELADGDAHRELLTRAFGTITFGCLAVNGFFLISGYLIAASFVADPDPARFLTKRVARIMPAFLVASLLCMAIVAPLGGADAAGLVAHPLAALRRALLLQPPTAPGAFAGRPYPGLDGSTWTIAYEFRCYLLVAVLGMAGLLRRARIVAAAAATCLAAQALLPFGPVFALTLKLPYWWLWLGMPFETLRLCGLFLTGTLAFLLRDRLRYTARGAAVAAAALAACLCSPALATPGTALAGGYLVFACAFRCGGGRLGRVGARHDVSYGLYLYAWPVEKLLLWYAPGLPLAVTGGITVAAAVACGWASWLLVERPAQRAGKRLCRSPLLARTATPAAQGLEAVPA